MINAAFYIAVQLLGVLARKVENANKRARRAGQAGYEITVDRSDFVDVVWSEHDGLIQGVTRKVKVTISGTATEIQGWQVVGAIDLSLASDVLLGNVPEEYRGKGGTCDHCGHKRNRKKTVILRNVETGETKQIGATCLTAFLPGADVEQIGAWLAGINRLSALAGNCSEDDGEGFGGFGGGSFDGYDVEAVLAYSAAAVREFGYLKTSNEGDTTRGRVLRSMFPSKYDLLEAARDPHYLTIPTVGDWARANEIRAWLRDVVAPTNPTGYLANLVAVAEPETVGGKFLGILCSAPQALKSAETREAERKAREAEREAARANERNEHLGAVGERICGTFRVLWVTLREGQFGYTSIVKLADPEGRKAVWFASNEPDVERGDVLSLKGTIKRLGEFKGTRETTLTRCRFDYEAKVERDDERRW